MDRALPAPLAAGLLLWACGGMPPEAADVAAPRAAIAVLHPTRGNDVRGIVRFQPTPRGMRVVSHVSGLGPGPHAYHVHVWGDCSAPDGTSAGTHFNFLGSSQDPPEDIGRITGNLGELEADADGNAHHEALVEEAALRGPKTILARAVIVHARGNDPEQPPIGAAGARLACGVVGVDEAEERGASSSG